MKIVLVPSVIGLRTPAQNLSSFVINDTVAIDAGSLGFMLPLDEQRRVRDVLLTHSHIDHIASLPIFLENVYENGDPAGPVNIHATPETIASLNDDVFNGRLYPDTGILNGNGTPFVRISELTPGRPVTIGAIRFTPFEVNHTVPTVGFRIESEDGSAVLISDTAPTGAILSAVSDLPDLRAVFLEVAFPNDLAWLARASKHLTPADFLAEVARFPPGVAAYAMHVKPRHAERIAEEVLACGLGHVELMEPGREYHIGRRG